MAFSQIHLPSSGLEAQFCQFSQEWDAFVTPLFEFFGRRRFFILFEVMSCFPFGRELQGTVKGESVECPASVLPASFWLLQAVFLELPKQCLRCSFGLQLFGANTLALSCRIDSFEQGKAYQRAEDFSERKATLFACH